MVSAVHGARSVQSAECVRSDVFALYHRDAAQLRRLGANSDGCKTEISSVLPLLTYSDM